MSAVKKVVVAGAGFGGLKAYRRLAKQFKNNSAVELTLINDVNYFLFTPLLHEVATGSLFPENIIVPLPPLATGPGRRFFVGRVESVLLNNQEVLTSHGAVKYDYLVLALGSENNFYDTPGAAEHTLPLKDLDDAARIKNQIISRFEEAQHYSADRAKFKELLTFVIVGGGPAGVEMAGELADFCRGTFAKLYPALAEAARIVVVQKDNHILPQFSDQLRRRSLSILGRKGVEVLVNTGVEAIKSGQVNLSDGQKIAAGTVIWAAGVKPREVKFDRPIKTERGRLVVNEHLQLESDEAIFAIGDVAAYFDPASQAPLPALAQVADREAKTAAHNVASLITGQALKPFKYRSQGSLLSLGSWRGAGEVLGFHFAGRLAWLLWRAVYWAKMPTAGKKLQILVDWFLIAFSPRDVSLLPFTKDDIHQ